MNLFTRITGAVAAGATALVDAAVASWAESRPTAAGAVLSAREGGEEVAHPAPYQERDPHILGNRLTPARLAAIIARRNEGHFQDWIDLGAEFLSGKNPHLLTQLGVRRASVAETRLQVRPGKGTNRQGAGRAARDFEDLLERWKARQEFEPVLAQVTMAEWWGRSLHELLWTDAEAGFMAPEHALWIHPRRLSYACPLGDPEPWTIRLHDPDDWTSPFSGPYGKPITLWHPDKFVLHETVPLGVHKTGEGLFAGVIWYLVMYEWDWRDLMALVELLGRPAVIGYYNAGGAKADGSLAKTNGDHKASQEQIAALDRVVKQMSGSLRAALADTTRVEALQHGQRATPLQLEVAKHIEALISKALNGTTGVTDIVAGSRAAQQVAWQQSLTFWRYDVRRVCGWLRDVAGRMVRAHPRRYGLGCPVPEVFAPEIESAPSGTTGAEDPAKEAA